MDYMYYANVFYYTCNYNCTVIHSVCMDEDERAKLMTLKKFMARTPKSIAPTSNSVNSELRLHFVYSR